MFMRKTFLLHNHLWSPSDWQMSSSKPVSPTYTLPWTSMWAVQVPLYCKQSMHLCCFQKQWSSTLSVYGSKRKFKHVYVIYSTCPMGIQQFAKRHGLHKCQVNSGCYIRMKQNSPKVKAWNNDYATLCLKRNSKKFSWKNPEGRVYKKRNVHVEFLFVGKALTPGLKSNKIGSSRFLFSVGESGGEGEERFNFCIHGTLPLFEVRENDAR